MIGPKMRIVTGPAAVVEHELNKEWETYVIQSLTITVVKDELVFSAILVARSEFRKAQLMNPAGGLGRPQ